MIRWNGWRVQLVSTLCLVGSKTACRNGWAIVQSRRSNYLAGDGTSGGVDGRARDRVGGARAPASDFLPGLLTQVRACCSLPVPEPSTRQGKFTASEPMCPAGNLPHRLPMKLCCLPDADVGEPVSRQATSPASSRQLPSIPTVTLLSPSLHPFSPSFMFLPVCPRAQPYQHHHATPRSHNL